MKLSTLAVCVATLAMPLAAFAQQSGSGLTRAEVRAELFELEQTGWRPTDDGTYPEKIQEAEARVSAKHAAGTQVAVSNGNVPAAGANGS